MPGWNIADVLETVAGEVPDSPAAIQGGRVVTWEEMDRRANAVAARLLAAGLPRQSNVAQYLRNCPEYIESMYACLKASLVPVNTNYRYGPDELVYLWENSDTRAVIFHGEFVPQIERVRDRVPGVRAWLWVDDGTGDCPEWATDYQAVARDGATASRPDVERGGDDLLLLYTGGTTGMPKGVMWRQDDLFVLLGNAARGGYPDRPDLGYARSRVAKKGRRLLPAAPLMHGAGSFSCVPVLARGGAVVLLEGRSFDPVEFLDTVERHEVFSVSWVGDAFAKPVAKTLDAHPGRWSLPSLRTITSGGVIFSDTTKRRLLDHVPHLLLNDVFGASEAITVGSAIATKDTIGDANGAFAPRPDMRVIGANGRDVEPGSGEPGLIAFAGRQPLGYYKDPDKTAEVFRTLDGRRHSVPGDWAVVASDGSVTLLGRGSACINTGGEKVYPDEVEKVIGALDGVVDTAVIGVPHERFGEAVVAVVQADPDAGLTPEAVIGHTKAHLAGYKAPRDVVFVGSLQRGPTGKLDLRSLRARIAERLGAQPLRT
jgi:acyl-CoA synthetase (AMP-forming)/AMP-acid ligase II